MLHQPFPDHFGAALGQLPFGGGASLVVGIDADLDVDVAPVVLSVDQELQPGIGPGPQIDPLDELEELLLHGLPVDPGEGAVERLVVVPHLVDRLEELEESLAVFRLLAQTIVRSHKTESNQIGAGDIRRNSLR